MTTKYKRIFIFFLMIVCIVAMFPIPTYAATTTTKVHYINVGQGDSVLIESNKRYMLIDAGKDADTVANYLKKNNVKKLDYLVLTHPDADHIGGASKVVKSVTINKIIMPNKSHTSKTYEQLLKNIKSKKLKITKPKVGTTYTLGKASFTIIAPNKNYSDNNNSSVGLRLVHGKNSFLFIGDAESTGIKDIQNNKQILKSNVLMVGHHGANTSTTKSFLKAVKPSAAIISVGKNSYDHPTSNVLKLLSDANIDIYRTDTSGTIIVTSNGSKLTYSGKKYKVGKTTTVSGSKDNKSSSSTTNSSQTTSSKHSHVYVTKTGKKYHLTSCPTLKSKIKITYSSAVKQGYTPCKVCNP